MSTTGRVLSTHKGGDLRIATLSRWAPSKGVASTLIRMPEGGEIITSSFSAPTGRAGPRGCLSWQETGEWTAELRSAARDLRRGLEAEVTDIKQVGDDLKAPLDELKKSSEDVRKGIEEAGVSRLDWEGPKPISGPTRRTRWPIWRRSRRGPAKRVPGDRGQTSVHPRPSRGAPLAGGQDLHRSPRGWCGGPHLRRPAAVHPRGPFTPPRRPTSCRHSPLPSSGVCSCGSGSSEG